MSLLRSETRGAVASGSPTYNPFNNPSVPLASVGFDNLWSTNNNDAGQSVTELTAAGVATFYRCLFLLSSVVGGCPLEEFRKSDRTQIDNPLFDPANMDLTYTPFEYKQLITVYRCVWGDAFVYKKRAPNSTQIIDLKPIYPDFVTVKIDRKTGDKVFEVDKLDENGNPTGVKMPFTTYEIMHIPGLGYNGLQGLKVVGLMAQTLGTALGADKLAAKFLSKGTQLGGIIKIKAPLRSQLQAEGIKARWMNAHGGVSHAGDVAVLDAETDWQDVTIPPDQLQFLESRRWETTEIARWFGVPPHLVGDVEKSTSWGTGIEQQNLGLDKFTLVGHFVPIEERHTREVVQVRGHYAKFNRDELLRGSTLERYQALLTATGGPWQSVNEARVSENMQPKSDPKYDEILPPQGIGPTGPNGASTNQPTQKVGVKPNG